MSDATRAFTKSSGAKTIKPEGFVKFVQFVSDFFQGLSQADFEQALRSRLEILAGSANSKPFDTNSTNLHEECETRYPQGEFVSTFLLLIQSI